MATVTKRKKRRSRGGIYVLLTVILTLAAVTVGIGLFFKVEAIEVTGNSVYDDDEIIKASGINKGDNMLILEEKLIAPRLTDKLSYIEGADIIKSFPSTVRIKVKEDAPIAYFRAEGNVWLINTACRLYKSQKAADTEGLIKLNGADFTDIEEGTVAVSGKVKFIQELFAAIRDNGIEDKITEIDVSNIGSIAFDYDGRFAVNLGSEGEIKNKVAMLIGAESKIDANARGRLEFTTDIELHFMPES